MALSLVIPAYVPNEQLLEVTRRCFDSLDATTRKRQYQLVVIDNGSIADASNMLEDRAEACDGRYLYYSEPIGYGRAANIGLATAHHDFIAVVNTDIQFQKEGWIETFLSDYAETPGGVLSAMDDGRQGIVYDESWFSCWITERKVIQDVGYFDEAMAYRFHDQDYAIRVHQAGYKVMRTGNVPVSHINSATYDTMGRSEDPAERAMMQRRYGCSLYADWVRQVTA